MVQNDAQPSTSGFSLDGPQTRIAKAKTRRGQRYLERRAPKLVEDAKRALLLYGNSTSQVVKDVLADLHKLKAQESVKYTRNNSEVQPFEPGGEAKLEAYANKSNCSLFVLGSHTKKRPHNLVLGRMYDFHLYDVLELGVQRHKAICEFKGAAAAQVGNKPTILFVGERFESNPQHALAKSLLLDFFRGLQVSTINLAGLDRVIMAVAASDSTVLLRQYAIRLKKSGTKVPRVALEEMGPSLDLTLRRHREAPVDLAAEATKKAIKTKKKVKNVGSDLLDGKVGRIYMPKQNVEGLALAKPKGLKRERREAAAARVEANHAPASKRQRADDSDGGDSE